MFDDIEKQYKGGTTIAELSRVHGISVDRIRLHLKRVGAYKQSKPYKVEVDETLICDMYRQDYTPKEIADHIGTSEAPVVRVLKKHNIRKPVWLKGVPYNKLEKLLDREQFEQVVSECITMANVQERLGINYDLAASLYKYHKIKNAPSAVNRSRLIQKTRGVVDLSKENFIQLYGTDRLSVVEVARKFGVSVNYLRELIRSEWQLSHLMRTGSDTQISEAWFNARTNPEYIQQLLLEPKTLQEIADMFECSACTVQAFVAQHNLTYHESMFGSSGERAVMDFVRQLLPNDEIIARDRKHIHPHELDIFIPSKRLAIEYCGLYWHSDAIKPDPKYHLNKLQKCIDAGIRLLTIFEDEWVDNRRICESKIASLINAPGRVKINARDCRVAEISYQTKKEFLDCNHLQGNDICKVQLGLFYREELVAVATFAKPSRSRNSAKSLTMAGLWELNRYATSLKHHVRGGAGKLLSYFKSNYSWTEIYSYADRRWSMGEMYKTLGFVLDGVSSPNYWYVPPRCNRREYRFNYTKKSLVDQGYDPNLTEKQIMKNRKYYRIWDCGVLKFSLKNDQQK